VTDVTKTENVMNVLAKPLITGETHTQKVH